MRLSYSIIHDLTPGDDSTTPGTCDTQDERQGMFNQRVLVTVFIAHGKAKGYSTHSVILMAYSVKQSLEMI